MVTRTLRGLNLSLALLLLTGGHLPARADGVLEQMQSDIATIVRNSKNGIVSIEDEGTGQGRRFGGTGVGAEQRNRETKGTPSVRRGGPPQNRTTAPKSGSGFSIGNGYIVTTADVVEGMQHPMIITDDGTHIRAKLVGIDAEMNLGLLQLPPKANLPALKLGDSDTAAAGHFAISIGNQAGHNNSVALTMIAGIRSEGTFTGERFYPALIQIAGTVGAGTSGAPILNARGEVIGVIAGVPVGEWTETQFVTYPQSSSPFPGPQLRPNIPEGGFSPGVPLQAPGRGPTTPLPSLPAQSAATEAAGQAVTRLFLRPPVTSAGFAIPINDLQSSIKELIATGKIVPIWFGFDLNNERKVVDEDGIIRMTRFVRVRGIYPDSPAQRAGLQPGDILIELNGQPLKSMSGLRIVMMRLHPADKLPVTVSRNGVNQNVTLTAEARPATITPPPSPHK